MHRPLEEKLTMIARSSAVTLSLLVLLGLVGCTAAAPETGTGAGTPAGQAEATAYPAMPTLASMATPAATVASNAAKTAAEAFVDGGPHYVAAAAVAEAV